MCMLCWICGHRRRDRVRNDDVRDRLGVNTNWGKACPTSVEMVGHVQRRPTVRRGILRRDNNEKRRRGRPKLAWEEAVKGDLKE
jgi:hypothetical protein